VVSPVPQLEERKRSSKRTTPFGFEFWRTHNRKSFFGRSEHGQSRPFQYPESERVRYGSRDAAAIRLFQCSSFAEQGTVSALSFVLVIRSEMGLGCAALTAAPFDCELGFNEAGQFQAWNS